LRRSIFLETGSRVSPALAAECPQPHAKTQPSNSGASLVCARKEPYVARFIFEKVLFLGFTMPKQAAKIPVCESDDPASDGYYVFVSLIGTVLVTICAILMAFGVEMLAS
jgi:hypothetical protein